MSKTTHTPTPWRADYSPMASFQGEITCWRVLKDKKIIADACSPDHAERIVLCCNAHDDLVAALEVLLRESMAPTDDGGRWDDACAFARQVLAKAGEK